MASNKKAFKMTNKTSLFGNENFKRKILQPKSDNNNVVPISMYSLSKTIAIFILNVKI